MLQYLHRSRWYPPITNPQWETLEKLVTLGYWISNRYSDGVLNVKRGDIMIFVKPDGKLQPPRTYETMSAHVELIQAGFDNPRYP